MIAVTALSCLDHHIKTQHQTLDSWSRAGLTIVAVNSTTEIPRLSAIYTQVNYWVTSNELTVGYETPTQKIRSLAQCAITFDSSIMIINSDIELSNAGIPLVYAKIALERGQFVIGYRHNYKSDPSNLTMEPWGIDVFFMTPRMALTLPDCGLGIGKPVWDYWLPYHFRTLNYGIEAISDPCFLHKEHDRNWSDDEWNYAASLVQKHYGENSISGATAVDFRKSLPVPPVGMP